MQEIEIKFLDVNPSIIGKKIKKLGGKKIFDQVFEEWIFKKPEWENTRGRVRVRKQEGKVTIAYKETINKTSEGNLEIEFDTGDAKSAIEFIKKLGIPLARYQQKRRINYELKGVTVDVDFWPKIPPYVEIEGDSEESVNSTAELLGFDLDKKVELDAMQIYKQIYGVNVGEIKKLIF